MNAPAIRRSIAAVLIAAGALLTSGCGSGWTQLQISWVSVSADGRTLDVGWHCHVDAEVDVAESEKEIRLTLRAHNYKGDCADHVRTTLAKPLGDRLVVDAVTGTTVEPCAAEEGGPRAIGRCE